MRVSKTTCLSSSLWDYEKNPEDLPQNYIYTHTFTIKSESANQPIREVRKYHYNAFKCKQSNVLYTCKKINFKITFYFCNLA